MSLVSDKTVLITGGCGSIGSCLVEHVLDRDPAVVRVFDTDEQGLFSLQQRFEDSRLRYLLGDIRDRDRLTLALEDVDVVFHAAALKHVELNEYNPFEAVRTNVQGTQNLVRAALDADVDSFVTISTDKASNPISVMGATKLLSERLVVAANAYKGRRDTQFGCVRFGNVLGSAGSVVPVFRSQIRAGGPVTVTDPEMTRFIMPIDEAASLVLTAHERMKSGETFVLKMPAIRVGTLAEAAIEEYAPAFGYDVSDIDTEIVGPRPGERHHEKLIAADEVEHTQELEDMYVIRPQIDVPGYVQETGTDDAGVSSEYTSADTELLSKAEITELLNRYCGVEGGPVG